MNPLPRPLAISSKIFTLLVSASLLVTSVGCNDGGGGGGGGGGGENALTGTWLVNKEGSPAYWTFNSDGTFRKNRAGEPPNGDTHFTGTYSFSSGNLQGEFTNPGVGTGEIKGRIEDGVLKMDFIEYWHTPPKVVPTTGKRIQGGAGANLESGTTAGTGGSGGNGRNVLRPSEDGSAGFLWKPVANNGRLVVLFPEDISPTVAQGQIHRAFPPTGSSLVEEGELDNRTHNGGRAHFRFSKPGQAYGRNLYAVAVMPDGQRIGFAVADGGDRVN